MSQESSKVLTRQWKIIQFLLNSSFVSTADIEEHLYQQGTETAQRTIQRDLNLLEKLFPLECRRDCMPYSWRWKKTQSTVKGLNLTQAFILRLVNEELQDILPKHTMEELAPLFEKAKLITSNAIMDGKEKSILDILNRSQKYPGFVQPSIVTELISNMSEKVNGIYRSVLSIDEKEIQSALKQVVIVLENCELPELAQALRAS